MRTSAPGSYEARLLYRVARAYYEDDLTQEEIGVPVVRVLVPGLEVFAMDNERIGSRCRDAERSRLPRAKP